MAFKSLPPSVLERLKQSVERRLLFLFSALGAFASAILAQGLGLSLIAPGMIVIGAGLGSLFDPFSRRIRTNRSYRQQVFRDCALAALIGRLARSWDIQGDVIEHSWLAQQIDRSNLESLRLWYALGHKESHAVLLPWRGFVAYCAPSQTVLASTAAQLYGWFDGLGAFEPKRFETLLDLCQRMGYPRSYLQEQHAMQSPDDSGSPTTIKQALAVLDVAMPISKKALQKHFRLLVSQTHPDRLIAQNADDNAVAQATTRIQHLRKAYELVEKHAD